MRDRAETGRTTKRALLKCGVSLAMLALLVCRGNGGGHAVLQGADGKPENETVVVFLGNYLALYQKLQERGASGNRTNTSPSDAAAIERSPEPFRRKNARERPAYLRRVAS